MRRGYRKRYRQNNGVGLISILHTLSTLSWRGALILGVTGFILFYGGALLLEAAISQQTNGILQPVVDMINGRRLNWLKKVAMILLMLGVLFATYKYLFKKA